MGGQANVKFPQGTKSRRRLARVGVEVFAYVETENARRRRKRHEELSEHARPPRSAAALRRPLVKRIDGARHWPKTLDQFVWLLLRAGITPDQLTQAVSASLRKHRKTRGLTMPSPEVLEYGRVLTYWQHEPAYLDEHGRARSLSLTGRSPSFAALGAPIGTECRSFRCIGGLVPPRLGE